MGCLAIISGIVAMSFGFYYMSVKPRRNVYNRIRNLMLWNISSVVFIGGVVACFTYRYLHDLSTSVLRPLDIANYWRTDWVAMEYSYTLVVCSIGVFIFNIIVIGITSCCHGYQSRNDTHSQQHSNRSKLREFTAHCQEEMRHGLSY
ncbi:uncharacterized protein LOC144352339 [Saccoglossus kowalevskii]